LNAAASGSEPTPRVSKMIRTILVFIFRYYFNWPYRSRVSSIKSFHDFI
jgi:hypothetical protein